jgi:hypothetical protein
MMKNVIHFRKNSLRIVTAIWAILIFFILISSCSISMTFNNLSNNDDFPYLGKETKTELPCKSSSGLAPNIAIENLNIPKVSLPFDEEMWGYIVNSSVFDEGTCYFDVDNPGDIVYLQDTESNNFLSGGTGTSDEYWLAVEYDNGVLWEIDWETGDMTYIGGGGASLNGLAWDLVYNQMFGASGSKLYMVDPENGEQEEIGSFGNDVNEMIGIAVNTEGVMYGWDLGDKLWQIDKETGETLEVGPLGIDINYAQDGDFCHETGYLYLTAYTVSPNIGSYLYVCDKETGDCELIGQFEGNSQITASVKSCGMPPLPTDIGIKNIINPNYGDASEEIEVAVTVKNYGWQSEDDVPVNVVISKDGIFEEYNETKYIDIDYGETIDVEMTSWTPNDWQSVSNEYIDYKITAIVDVYNDANETNDCKEKLFELYFAYLHDVGCSDVLGPETGPAQTFPMNSTIKNFGQFDECCFKTYVEVAEHDIETEDIFIDQDFSVSQFPPLGWSTTHDNWMFSESNYAGGSIGEARLNYLPTEYDVFRLNSPLINTSNYDLINIEFKHFLNHSGCVYKLEVDTSYDNENWTTIWEALAIGDIGPENVTIFTNENVGSTTYVSLALNGSCLYENNWYLDDIVIKGYTTLEPEYEDDVCISQIDSGEEIELEFDKWTPDFLSEEQSGTKIYVCNSWTDMYDPQDENPDNDLFSKVIELEYFHDVGIKEIMGKTVLSLPKREYIPFPNIYFTPGSQSINATVENLGTFSEIGLTCYVEIYEYITNYSQGTLVYEDNDSSIDLEEPLGGNKLLDFDFYSFEMEGVYEIEMNFPLEEDNFPENNHEYLVVGVDDSPPIVEVELDPPDPDGENGWYVNPPNVTIYAHDPEIAPGIPGSGVEFIQYRINNDPWQIINDDSYTISITQNGEINIEVLACDKVGNCATVSSVKIYIDQIEPVISEVEWEAYKKSGNWHVQFTCEATDDISGMNQVEMYINDGLFETIESPGPEYIFEIEWNHLYIDIVFNFYHYDDAGNIIIDDVQGSDINSLSITESIYILKNENRNHVNIQNNLTGPSYGRPGVEYTFCIEFNDPEEDAIYSIWDWGDGSNTDWIGPYSSGEMICQSHSWNDEGLYVIKVKIRDEFGNESNWFTHEILIEGKPPLLEINRPKRAVYFNDRWITPFIVPVVIGNIQIWFWANDSESGLEHIELYIDNELKDIFHTIPKSWKWDEKLFYKHEIKLVAYDKAGNINSETKDVWKFF